MGKIPLQEGDLPERDKNTQIGDAALDLQLAVFKSFERKGSPGPDGQGHGGQ